MDTVLTETVCLRAETINRAMDDKGSEKRNLSRQHGHTRRVTGGVCILPFL